MEFLEQITTAKISLGNPFVWVTAYIGLAALFFSRVKGIVSEFDKPYDSLGRVMTASWAFILWGTSPIWLTTFCVALRPTWRVFMAGTRQAEKLFDLKGQEHD